MTVIERELLAVELYESAAREYWQTNPTKGNHGWIYAGEFTRNDFRRQAEMMFEEARKLSVKVI